ncbi:MAG TPA: hypothetical protein VG820_07510 [Fimbriimonadaceae bacterium]|nr:hypothetical protein [Fimbriimonadaceae bacterium]
MLDTVTRAHRETNAGQDRKSWHRVDGVADGYPTLPSVAEKSFQRAGPPAWEWEVDAGKDSALTQSVPITSVEPKAFQVIAANQVRLTMSSHAFFQADAEGRSRDIGWAFEQLELDLVCRMAEQIVRITDFEPVEQADGARLDKGLSFADVLLKTGASESHLGLTMLQDIGDRDQG